jgi:hypothetical protein
METTVHKEEIKSVALLTGSIINNNNNNNNNIDNSYNSSVLAKVPSEEVFLFWL